MPERRHAMRLRCCCALVLWATCSLAWADASDSDWQETEVPPPPAFSTNHLLMLDMPRYLSVKLGIDPATLQITPDGVVRYVLVSTSPQGLVNALYEGIRCATGEVKTYARTSGTNPWTLVRQAGWRGLHDAQPSRHALVFARQGACEGNSARNTPDDIVRAMKN